MFSCISHQLQQALHDDPMNAIQSNEGQEARNLGEALHSKIGSNGESILNTIHKNNFMKKVRNPRCNNGSSS